MYLQNAIMLVFLLLPHVLINFTKRFGKEMDLGMALAARGIFVKYIRSFSRFLALQCWKDFTDIQKAIRKCTHYCLKDQDMTFFALDF